VIAALVLGIALGGFAGIVPGPFFTMVATTGVREGVRGGVRVALVPMITEPLPMLASVLLITRLPEEALRWLGVVGGVLLLYVAWRVASSGKESEEQHEAGDNGGPGFFHTAALGLVSPTPWAFWLLVGGPIILDRWHQEPLFGVLFAVSFLTFFVGSLVGIAWVSAATGHQLGARGSKRFFYGAGAFLALAGLVIAWQSWVGSFAEMVQAPERIEEEVGQRTEEPLPLERVARRVESLALASDPYSFP
jgi:threonine/homoserine/homoserine lactone efflux protein